MSSSLLDTDRDMLAEDRSDGMQEFLAEQERFKAQQQQQKKAMLMELRAVYLWIDYMWMLAAIFLHLCHYHSLRGS